jgi:hypothetical protein
MSNAQTPTVESEPGRLERIERELADVKIHEAFRRGEVWPERLSNQEIIIRQNEASLGRLADAQAKTDAIERARERERPERRKLDREIARIRAEREKVRAEGEALIHRAEEMWADQIALQNTQLESDRLAQIHPSRFREGVPQ